METTQNTQETSFLDRARGWLDHLPGYQGYRQEESRRDADKALRVHLAKKLSLCKSKLQDIQEEKLEEEGLGAMSGFEKVSSKFDKLNEKTEHARYGYSGLFSDDEVDSAKLEQVYEIDLGLVAKVEELEDALAQSSEADSKSLLKNLGKILDQYGDILESRDAYLDGKEL